MKNNTAAKPFEYDCQWLAPSWNKGGTTRLFCFPHAGGGASAYREWQNYFSDEYEVLAVQPPGRENRVNDALIDRMEDMVGEIVKALIPFLDRPFAFFGHSMGALVAYEVVRELIRRQLPQPLTLIVSAKGAPHVRTAKKDRHLLSNAGLKAEVAGYGGIPSDVYSCDDMMALCLPVLRADFKLLETYHHRHASALSVPTLAIAALDDEEIEPRSVAAWQLFCPQNFEYVQYSGGHFYYNHDLASVLVTIQDWLQQYNPILNAIESEVSE